MGPGVNILKGLSILRPGNEHHAILSQLHLERHLEQIRYIEAARMGPPEQESLHRPTRNETAIRRAYYQARRKALRDPRYNTR